jgi:hypothetical protein
MATRIDRREDVNPKEGVREYGNVEFADPTFRTLTIRLGARVATPNTKRAGIMKRRISFS